MQSSFTTDPRVTVLFKPFHVETPLGIIVTCVVFCLASIVYEGLKCLRLNLAEKSGWRTMKKSCMTKAHGIQTVLYMVEFTFSYALMLAVMTFNVWMFAAIVIGSLLGLQGCVLLRGSHANLAGTRHGKSEDGSKRIEDMHSTDQASGGQFDSLVPDKSDKHKSGEQSKRQREIVEKTSTV